jgi:esterase
MSRGRNEALSLAFSDPRESGLPVLFVHGIAHNRVVWEKLIRDLPSSMRPISVDLRGHGESPWSISGEYDLPDHASDLPGVLDELGLDRAYVVAHSLGGNAATLFAASSPERVQGLVLVDTGPVLDAGGVAHVAGEVESVLTSFASRAEYRRRLSQMHSIGDPPILDRLAETSLVERLDGRFELAIDPAVLGAAGDGADLGALERELWTALRTLACPVLLVRGGISAILSEKVATEMVDEVIPDARLVTLPESGHSVMIDAGAGLASTIREFISFEAAS